MAGRSLGGAARSARPGAEPRVPGSLPRVELDLSHVLFVATANVADTIPARCSTGWK